MSIFSGSRKPIRGSLVVMRAIPMITKTPIAVASAEITENILASDLVAGSGVGGICCVVGSILFLT